MEEHPYKPPLESESGAASNSGIKRRVKAGILYGCAALILFLGLADGALSALTPTESVVDEAIGPAVAAIFGICVCLIAARFA